MMLVAWIVFAVYTTMLRKYEYAVVAYAVVAFLLWVEVRRWRRGRPAGPSISKKTSQEALPPALKRAKRKKPARASRTKHTDR
jgi:membrane protein implicated in regulation of membrane protease activity